jgi:hypothetical protein
LGRRVTPKQEAKRLRSRLKRIDKLKVTALNATLVLLKRKVISEHLSGPTGVNSVRRQSGKLKKSIQTSKARLERGRFGLGATRAVAIFRFNSEYAGVHIGKRGRRTKIRPKRAQFLAIPTKFARSSTGRPLGSPRDPRWGRTFVAHDIIWGTRAGTKNPRPLFVLRDSVIVPQRVDIKKDIVKPGQAIYKRKIEEGLQRILK